MQSALVVEYRLDQVNGNTVPDRSGDNVEATQFGSPLIVDDEKFGGVMDFNGTDQYLRLNQNSNLQIVGNQTIMMWLKPRDFSRRQNPYDKSYGGEGSITLETGGRISYYYGAGSGNAHPYSGFSTISNLNLNKWNHVAVVRDLNQGKMRWYLNGVLDVTKDASLVPSASTRYAQIGNGYAGFYSGAIARFRMFNDALDGQQVRTLMHQDAAGLYIHWPLDEIGSGNSIQDHSGQDAHGTTFGSPQIEADPTFGSCLKFTSTNGVKLQPSEFPIHAVSASIWIKSTATKETGIVSYAGSSAFTNGFLIFDSRNLAPHIFNTKTLSGTSVADGKWHHIVQTWRRSDGRVQLFVDGENVLLTTLHAEKTMPSGGALVLAQDQDSLGGGFNSNQGFVGNLAHFRLYAKELIVADIRREIEADLSQFSQYNSDFPLEFNLHADDNRRVLPIDDAVDQHALHLDLKNGSTEAIAWTGAGSAIPSAQSFVLHLRFLSGALDPMALGAIVSANTQWTMALVKEVDFINLYFLPVASGGIPAGNSHRLTLDHFKAEHGTGTRNTEVQLRFNKMTRGASSRELTGIRSQSLTLLKRSGSKNAPFHAVFNGSDMVLNVNAISNDFELQLCNNGDTPVLFNPTGSANESNIVLEFDIQKDGTSQPCALCTEAEIQNVTVSATGWNVNQIMQGHRPTWTIETSAMQTLAPGENIAITIAGLVSSLPSGHTPAKIHYFNVPDFQDGSLTVQLTKSPMAIRGNRVGLGVDTPLAQLSLGNWNAGHAGTLGGVQMHLSGRHNAGVNQEGTKLLIDGYNNDGPIVYPIYVKDENNNVDFYLQNRHASSGDPLLYLKGNAAIGITPSYSSPYRLHVGGNIGASSFLQTSSLRFKKEVTPLEGALDLIHQLEGVKFKWKADERPDIGFIAEEVDKVVPVAVVRNGEGQVETMSYSHIIPLLVNAMQEQQVMIAAQTAALEVLQTTVADLKAQLEQLTASI